MSAPPGPYGPPPDGYGDQVPPQEGAPQGYPQQGYVQQEYPAPYGPPIARGDHNCVGARVVQYLLDVLVLPVFPVIIIAIVIGVVGAMIGGWGGTPGGMGLVFVILVFGVFFANYVWRPTVNDGQTLGMKWLGLRIVKLDGSPLTMGDTALRWVLLIVDGIGSGLVGFIIMETNDLHQRLGDQVAKTLVVRAR